MPTTSNFGWTTPADTDLVKDGAAAIRTLGNGIDTSLVDLKGGTTGQILSKASNTDLDYTWITNDVGDITNVAVTAPITGGGSSGSVTIGIDDGTTTQKGAVQLEDSTSSTSTTKAATPNSVKSAYDLANAAIPKSLVDAAGDLIYATANDTVARLALGTANQVLTVNSGATAPEWKTPTASTPSFVGCSLYNSGAQSIATGTFTALTFDSERFDTNSFHSTVTNTSRITIPTGKDGKYLITSSIEMDTNTTGRRLVRLYKNGSAEIEMSRIPASSINPLAVGTVILSLSAADYIEVFVLQDSGSSQNINVLLAGGQFSVQFLGA
jgi:hypothetical protein